MLGLLFFIVIQISVAEEIAKIIGGCEGGDVDVDDDEDEVLLSSEFSIL